uniref:Putative secreted peptide n=1 Tax=Anopheles braziliensis TaxID=58242 RepID=A0A2M3ZP79_9DIPT
MHLAVLCLTLACESISCQFAYHESIAVSCHPEHLAMWSSFFTFVLRIVSSYQARQMCNCIGWWVGISSLQV